MRFKQRAIHEMNLRAVKSVTGSLAFHTSLIEYLFLRAELSVTHTGDQCEAIHKQIIRFYSLFLTFWRTNAAKSSLSAAKDTGR